MTQENRHSIEFSVSTHTNQKNIALSAALGKASEDMIKEYTRFGTMIGLAKQRGTPLHIINEDSRVEIIPFRYRSPDTLLDSTEAPRASRMRSARRPYKIQLPTDLEEMLRELGNQYETTVGDLIKEFFILGVDVFSDIKFNGASTVIHENGFDRPITLL